MTGGGERSGAGRRTGSDPSEGPEAKEDSSERKDVAPSRLREPSSLGLSDDELHLRILTGRDDPEVQFQVFGDTGDRLHPPSTFHCDLWKAQPRIEAAQLNGCGVYVTVNETDGNGRKAKNVVRARAAFVDLDGSPLPERWGLEPHLLVETSPGRYHAYWALEPSDDLTAWTDLQRRLAAYYGGDPSVCDPPRVARLAGYEHLKGEPFTCRVLLACDPSDVEDDGFSRPTTDEVAAAHPCEYRPAPSPPKRSSGGEEPPGGWDNDADMDAAKAWLGSEAPFSVQGQGGDATTYRVACRLRDMAISEDTAVRLMLEHWDDWCEPPWGGELERPVRNAYRYATGPAGCRSVAAGPPAEDDPPLEAWVWVADADQFVRRADLKKYRTAQWKSMYAGLKQDGDVLNAVWKGALPIRKFESLVYLPEAPEFPDGEGGGRYNIWRPSGVEPRQGDTSWFEEHMRFMFPDERDRELVLDYLAVMVQRPAEKIHFALLVRGEQGSGKSAIGELMRTVIGDRNVVKPSNDEILNKYTVWQEGAQLAIIEELMTLGRMEVANRLKQVITDPRLRIEEKYCSAYSIPNHLNLLCFTNHRDALRLEHGDRRWLVVFSPAKAAEQRYYDRLFGRIFSSDGPAAVKHMLLGRRTVLNPKGRAPQTKAKDEMRALSMGEVEAHLLELFERGEPPFDFDLVSMERVTASVPDKMQRRHRNLHATISKFLQDELGAVQHSRYTKSDGRRRACRLWSIRDHERWAQAGPSARYDAFSRRRASDDDEGPG